MAKARYKVRFRYVWTVYYDLSTNGSVVVTNYKTKSLAMRAMRQTLQEWIKTAEYQTDKVKGEIRLLLELGTDSGVLDAASAWSETQGWGSGGDTLWCAETRLVLSRKRVTP